jgi:hypothetical protein
MHIGLIQSNCVNVNRNSRGNISHFGTSPNKASDKDVKILSSAETCGVYQDGASSKLRAETSARGGGARAKGGRERVGDRANRVRHSTQSFIIWLLLSLAWRVSERVMFFLCESIPLSLSLSELDAFAACENTDTMEWRAERQ